MIYNINENKIFEQWAPTIEEKTGITEKAKLGWLSKYAHYHTLNESYSAYATLGNIPGMGAVTPGAAPAGQDVFYNGTTGSGDKFPSLLPLAMQVAQKTVGFDIVNVIPMPGPTGVLTYMDYVYAGGKLNTASKPIMIKVDGGTTVSSLTVGTTYFISQSASGSESSGEFRISVKYVGKSRIDGSKIFQILSETEQTYNGSAWVAGGTFSISDVFDGSAYVYDSGNVAKVNAIAGKPSLVTALEDHVQGFAGAGQDDLGNWTSSFDVNQINGGMSRETGESTPYRTMGLKTYTKFVAAETVQVAAAVTTEQIQDLAKQFGVDVVKMVENALSNELSQHINKHILQRIFALGWSNNASFLAVEGKTLNFTVDPATTSAGSVTYLGKDENAKTITVPGFVNYASGSTNSAENMYTIQRRIYSKILAAGNIVMQRGRRGPATFVVTNLQLATALQDNAQFQAAPLANSVQQNSGSLYQIGSIAGMAVYVDPNMHWDDTRVIVGRKGADEDPGVKFMPYLMAESIHTIAEGSMSPKIAVKSRYALVDAGQLPETMYYSFYVELGATSII